MPTQRFPTDQAAARWIARAKKIEQSIPQSFKQGTRKACNLARLQLQSEVYMSGGAHSKSGSLLRAEHMTHQSSRESWLRNNAKTGDKEYYSWYVAEGVPALSAPTKKGKKPVYVWMKNPTTPRPRGKGGWKAARAAGAVVVSRRIRAKLARPWREHANDKMQAAVRQGIENGKKAAFDA